MSLLKKLKKMIIGGFRSFHTINPKYEKINEKKNKFSTVDPLKTPHHSLDPIT